MSRYNFRPSDAPQNRSKTQSKKNQHHSPSSLTEPTKSLSLSKRRTESRPLGFFDLSGELRNQIYTYILQGTQSDTFYDDKKVQYVSSPKFHRALGFKVHGPQDINFNLLLCCKQTYQEGRSLLYSLNTFNIGVRSRRHDFELIHDYLTVCMDWSGGDGTSSSPAIAPFHDRLGRSIAPKNRETFRPKTQKGRAYRHFEYLFPFWSHLRNVRIKAEFCDIDRSAYIVRILLSHPLLVIHDVQVALFGCYNFYDRRGAPIRSEDPGERTKRAISILELLNVRGSIYVDDWSDWNY